VSLSAVPSAEPHAIENVPPSLSVQHIKSVEARELRGGKGGAAQRSPACREQKNSSFSLHSKVSPTSCSSYLVLKGTNQVSEQLNHSKPAGKFQSPLSNVMYTIQGGSAEGAQRYTPYASQNPPSGYSIKPFSQIHFSKAGQDHFRTPQAVAPGAGFEDLNNQEHQESRKGNSCTFLWRSSGQAGLRDATAKPDFRFVDSSKTANLK